MAVAARGDMLRIDVTGLRETQRALRKLQDKELQKELRGAHKKAAQAAADAGEAEAPKLTNKLAASVGARASGRGASVKAGTGKRVPYAGVIHFGWPKRGIAANEFLYRGISKKQKQITEAYEKDLTRIIKKAGLG